MNSGSFTGLKALVTGGAFGIGLATARQLRALGAAVAVLDVLVNNAGTGARGTVEDNSDEEWHRLFDVNVVGVVRVTRTALPYLRRSEDAAIVGT
ncbi:MAG TPA: SDR family NAD(P)-dependent oxidoreductase [Acidimicrobiales bacterium]|nr:SDR family NAD(P)-dependent oxidoreductase [Acidimicrobiales bacterium]